MKKSGAVRDVDGDTPVLEPVEVILQVFDEQCRLEKRAHDGRAINVESQLDVAR